MQNNVWRHLLLDISVRGATALIAGAMAAWIALQVMHVEIEVQQREIEAHTVAIQHVNDRIDTLQLEIGRAHV